MGPGARGPVLGRWAPPEEAWLQWGRHKGNEMLWGARMAQDLRAPLVPGSTPLQTVAPLPICIWGS